MQDLHTLDMTSETVNLTQMDNNHKYAVSHHQEYTM